MATGKLPQRAVLKHASEHPIFNCVDGNVGPMFKLIGDYNLNLNELRPAYYQPP